MLSLLVEDRVDEDDEVDVDDETAEDEDEVNADEDEDEDEPEDEVDDDEEGLELEVVVGGDVGIVVEELGFVSEKLTNSTDISCIRE